MLEPSCTTSGKSTQPENMMFTDHFASVLSIFHELIGTADLEKKRIFEPKNEPGRAGCPDRETRSFAGLTAGRGREAGELGGQSSPGSCLALPVA